jgi:hypothetical protein
LVIRLYPDKSEIPAARCTAGIFFARKKERRPSRDGAQPMRKAF